MNAPAHASRFRLAVEFALLFAGVPAVCASGWLAIPVIPVLVIMAGGCYIALRRQHTITPRDLLRVKASAVEWRRILTIYGIAVPLMACLLWVTKPDAMFSLIARHPGTWLLVMFAYPVASVLPQELVYRMFLFDRYHPLFGSGTGMVAASAVAFSFGHIVFHNWPAIIFTFMGGWLFATTYRRTSALLVVAIEHALYGCAVFTIGYGEFFFDGTLRLFRH